MSIYLDASVLASMLVADLNTPAALRFASGAPDCFTSVWAAAEFSSALFLRVGNNSMEPGERSQAEAGVDRWFATRPEPAVPILEDHVMARAMLRSCASALRAPDALHLAVCKRLNADLATFDRAMRQAAAEFSIVCVGL